MENILLLIAIILIMDHGDIKASSVVQFAFRLLKGFFDDSQGDRLSKNIVCFYLCCIASYYALPNIDDVSWAFVQVIIDLIIITLCFFSYTITKRFIFVLYILWVMAVYLVPGLFMLFGFEVWQYDNITMLASIVDVILAGRRNIHEWINRVFQSLRSCYTYLIKRAGGNNTSRIRNN